MRLLPLLLLPACAYLDPGAPTTGTVATDATDAPSSPDVRMPVACFESLGFQPAGKIPGRFEVRLVYLRPGTATSASLCVEDAPELSNSDKCKVFVGPLVTLPEVWTVELPGTGRFHVWTQGLQQGQFGADCFLDARDRSFMKWSNGHDFEAVFWVRRVEGAP